MNDLCIGMTDLDKCAAGTLDRLAKAPGVSNENLLDSTHQEYRSSFETFKSNTCHHVKDMGNVAFMLDLLETDEIRTLYEKQ